MAGRFHCCRLSLYRRSMCVSNHRWIITIKSWKRSVAHRRLPFIRAADGGATVTPTARRLHRHRQDQPPLPSPPRPAPVKVTGTVGRGLGPPPGLAVAIAPGRARRRHGHRHGRPPPPPSASARGRHRCRPLGGGARAHNQTIELIRQLLIDFNVDSLMSVGCISQVIIHHSFRSGRGSGSGEGEGRAEQGNFPSGCMCVCVLLLSFILAQAVYY